MLIRCPDSRLKGGWCVHPDDYGLGLSGIPPDMRRIALEVEAVSGTKMMGLTVQIDIQSAAQDEEKLFALVGVRLATSCTRHKSKEVGLHNRISPRQQLHLDTRSCIQALAILRTHSVRIGLRRIEEIQDIELVIACQFPQCAH